MTGWLVSAGLILCRGPEVLGLPVQVLVSSGANPKHQGGDWGTPAAPETARRLVPQSTPAGALGVPALVFWCQFAKVTLTYHLSILNC